MDYQGVPKCNFQSPCKMGGGAEGHLIVAEVNEGGVIMEADTDCSEAARSQGMPQPSEVEETGAPG